MAPADLVSSGVILLIVVTVAYGGTFLLRVTAGRIPANELQRSFYRAGHAHAAVLILLGLVVRLLLAQSDAVPAWSHTLAGGVLYAAVLMPAGFFLSVLGRNPQRPNRLALLIWAGAILLVVGLAGAGVGLIEAGRAG